MRVPPNAASARGPDGQSYKLVYVREATGPLATRGRYLVRDDGSVAFAVVASVDPDFPWRLERKAFSGAKLPLLEKRSYPGVRMEIPAGAPAQRGLDGKDYRVVTVAEAKEAVPAGGYLVAADGQITYSMNPATERGLDHANYRVVQTEREENGVPAGRYLVDETGAVTHVMHENWKFDAPKAQLFALIIDGTLDRRIPWGLVLVGMLFAVIMELVGVSSLPFAVGLYLPISTSAGIFTGGIVRRLVDRKRGERSALEAEFSPGVLMASGLIAGGAIAGVLQSIIAFYEKESVFDWSGSLPGLAKNETWWPMLLFLAMALLLYRIGRRGQPTTSRGSS
ncbi:MAG: OPT/YSL family transporter [Verrucomicrobia bacterium]|nr:OPT/YSL family transporter [Verrucomicrobiota bacterium]